MSPLILVLIILGGVLLLQAAVWIPLILMFKKRSAEFMAAFHRQLESSGEKLVVGGQTHFVIDTSDKAEIGFFVADNAAWARALKGASTP